MSTSAPLPPDALLRQGLSHHQAGRREAAMTAYRTVLAIDPEHAGANLNLGVALVQAGRPEEALAHLKRALLANAGAGLHWFSYAKGLLAAGHPARAQAMLQRADLLRLTDSRFDPLRTDIASAAPDLAEPTAGADDAALLDAVGGVLLAQGRTDEAVAHYSAAVAAAPDFAEAHHHLASVLSENGRLVEGFAHYMRRAALTHGVAAAGSPEPPHKIEHDRAQRAYLADHDPAAFCLAGGERLDGAAVEPARATPALFQAWRTSSPQMIVVDDFLAPAALERLQAYCAGSTIWRKVYDAGYLGAAPEDGFACPLLAQIVEEVQATYRPILDGHAFRYLGAFKYDSELCQGTNTHGDNSAVNINLYITPDEANLDPAHGGMVIWDRAAADLAELRRYNADETALQDMLQRSGAHVTVVPHRCNRAVIFKSSLFHRTDAFDFGRDYLSRRINVSLLFGELG